jgi:CheY-like chemotaxis protein
MEVLLVDDHAGDVIWMIEFLEERGYRVHEITNEEAARRQLEAVKKGDASYALAIIDIMVAIKDIMDLVESKERFYEKSRDTGIRLCYYARKELGISAETLPIVCVSARDDDQARQLLEELDIPLYSRTPQTPEEDIREYLRKKLPTVK